LTITLWAKSFRISGRSMTAGGPTQPMRTRERQTAKPSWECMIVPDTVMIGLIVLRLIIRTISAVTTRPSSITCGNPKTRL